MTSPTARGAALFAALATALFVSACSSTPASDGHTDHDHGEASQVQEASGQAADFNADFNDADVAFATDMIPHHQQAVELSAMVPGRSSDPAVVELAAAISAAQQPEIETMKVFLVQWNDGGDGGGDGHDGHDMGGMTMPGMVDGATMNRLQTLTGTEFDTLWLTSMIGHHEGAIDMADTEIAEGANTDAKTLAQDIVTTQRAEIDQMKQMLGG